MKKLQKRTVSIIGISAIILFLVCKNSILDICPVNNKSEKLVHQKICHEIPKSIPDNKKECKCSIQYFDIKLNESISFLKNIQTFLYSTNSIIPKQNKHAYNLSIFNKENIKSKNATYQYLDSIRLLI